MTEGEAGPGSGQVGKAGEASPCHTRAERMAEGEAGFASRGFVFLQMYP